VIAAIAIVATLRRLWRLQHPRRWQYLPVALALAVLVGFCFMSDARAVRLNRSADGTYMVFRVGYVDFIGASV